MDRLVNSNGQFLDKQQIHNEHDILHLPNFKHVKRKPVIPASTLDEFLRNLGKHIDDEKKYDNHTTADVHTPINNEHNKGLDDIVDEEELGGDEWDVKEENNIDCSTIGMS